MRIFCKRTVIGLLIALTAMLSVGCKTETTTDTYELTVGIDSTRLTVGSTAQLSVTEAKKNGEAVEAQVTWHANNEAVATVDEAGVLTAKAVGKVKVHARWEVAGLDSNALIVEVKAAPKTYALTIAADTASARIDQTVRLSVTEATEDGVAVDKPAGVVWRIASGKATVNDRGELIGNAAGKVTAYAVWNGVNSNDVEVTFSEESIPSDKLVLTDERFLTFYGRNVVGEQTATLYNTASACEFAFRGQSLTAALSATTAGAKVKVYVDGVAQPELLYLTSARKEYTLVEGRPIDERTTVKLVKVNSANKATVRLHGLKTDGTFVTPPPKPDLKLEFYGDSITCGYGVEGEKNADNASTENGTVSYAYLTAERLNAAAQMQCYSGIAVALPHTGWGVADDRYMANVFTEIAPQVYREKWDFTRYQADVIIVNLGTNDASAFNAGYGSIETFTSRYVRFVKDLRAKTPDAAIVLCYGMMGADGKINAAIQSVVKTCGLEDVYYLQQKTVSRTAYNGHPDPSGHAAGATELVQFLRSNGLV